MILSFLFVVSTLLIFLKPRQNLAYIVFYIFFWEVTFNQYFIEDLLGISLGDIAQALGVTTLTYVIFHTKGISKRVIIAISLNLVLLLMTFTLMALDATDVLVPAFDQNLDDLYWGTGNLFPVEFGYGNVSKALRFLLIIPLLIIFSTKFIDHNRLLIYFQRYVVFVFAICIIEFFSKILELHFIYELLYGIFIPNTLAPNLFEVRNGLPVIQALTAEPGHLPYLLLVPAIIFARLDGTKAKTLFYMICMLLFLTGSFRAFAVLIFVLLYRLNFSISFKGVTSVLFILIMTITITNIDFFIETSTRFQNVFNLLMGANIQGDTTSEVTRVFTWQYAISAFASRPFFGIGLGSISVLSGLLALTASIGVFGMLAYFFLLKTVFKVRFSSFFFIGVLGLMLFSWNINILYSPAVYMIFYSYKFLNSAPTMVNPK